MKNSKTLTFFIHAIFIIMTIGFLVPFLIIISVSISNEDDIVRYGFSLIPRQIDFTAFKILFEDFSKIGRSLLLTAIVSIVAPFCACAVQALIAYPLARDDYRLRKPLTWFVVFTMVFSGGTIPTYVFMTKYYHLGNNPLLYILSGMVTAWGIILYRTFFKGISASLIESAFIDGANQVQIIWYVILPMAKAIFAIQYFTGLINRWNDFQTSLLYMTDEKWFTIQYFMQRILNDAEVLKQAYAQAGLDNQIDIPIMTMRYAMCIIAVLPVFILFPYVQKYFSKGLAVGSVKG